tara:strand:- start:6852 stop:8177 length:1326 start_codon:yes stop_codon:yes gene_type:complete
MYLSKNKLFQLIFFTILVIYTIFNGGNSNILIQINFIALSFFFIICNYNKNYNTQLKYFINSNKKSNFFFILFLFYIIFQIISLPIEILKIFSFEKYSVLKKSFNTVKFYSISYDPSDTFFQFLNFASLFLIFLISKMIFQNNKHKKRFYLFISILGAVSSTVAILFYLNGNPDYYVIKNSHNIGSATGFFINRTVFSVFLLFCLLSCFEQLKYQKYKNSNKNFFYYIYLRLFVVIISIGIITSFSRIGNFLFLITIIFYLIDSVIFNKKTNKSFINLLIIFIIFDCFVLGMYFGIPKLMERLYFLKDEFNSLNDPNLVFFRPSIIEFSFLQMKKFILFGYGGGAFDILFQLEFKNSTNLYADHSHSDIVEFIGEYGLIGISFLALSLLKFFSKKETYLSVNLLISIYLIVIILFDFSLHVPIIQVFFVIFYFLNSRQFKN